MPFNEEQLMSHFVDVKKNGRCAKNEEHLNYYRESIERYIDYAGKYGEDRSGKPLKDMKLACQIEKDERFWIASCLMTIFHGKKRTQELARLFEDAYGSKPPIQISNWNECFDGELHLFFETNLPSPKPYKKWLRENFDKRHLIPYVRFSVCGKKNLEGPTNADAMIMNASNGFGVIIEAKVLSDISCEVTYDCMRNQIARSIDVMLEKNDDLCPPLNKREPEKTLFLLITPRLFKESPESRLYGYKFNEYKRSPESLAKDLPHREDCDWQNMSNRMGWLTWEDSARVNEDCCTWLRTQS